MRIPVVIVSAILTAHAFAPGIQGQRVSFGIVAGGYVNSDFDALFKPFPDGFPPTIIRPNSGGYLVGPTVEIHLSGPVSLEVDALFKQILYEASVGYINGALSYAPAPVVTWQFPVLAKYKFSLGAVKPFLEGGPSFRSAGNLNSSDPTHFGVSAGLGVEAQWRRLRFAPRIRYTRWAEDSPHLDVRTRSDQVEFLAAFSYVPESAFRPLGGRISIGGVVASTVSADIRPETSTSTGPNGEQYTSQVSAGRRAVVVAPLVEFALTPNLSIEANAIPRSFRTVLTVFDANGAELYSQSGSSGGTWEFPVLLKRRFQAGSLRPFVAFGPSFRLPKWTLPIYGGTVGLGVETRWKRLKIAPSVRYTRWGPERPLVPGVKAESGVRHDQVQVMVGWSF